MTVLWFLFTIGGALFLAYHRVSLRTATIAAAAALLLYSLLSSGGWLWLMVAIPVQVGAQTAPRRSLAAGALGRCADSRARPASAASAWRRGYRA